ncbi:MAG: hypothetical protein ACYTFY_12250 [Planctomycetota bacterium]|jgi:hypothetical protein
MNSFYKSLCFVLAVTLLLSAEIRSSEAEEGKDRYGRYIKISNSIITAKLRPDKKCIIEDLRRLDKNMMTFMPYHEERQELVRDSGIYGKSSVHIFGLTDAIWFGGLNVFRGASSYKIEKSKSGITVVLTQQGSQGWSITRTINLSENSSKLNIKIDLLYKGSKKVKKAYWLQGILRLNDNLVDNPGDDNEILIMPVRKESEVLQNISRATDEAKLVSRNPDINENYFMPPAQPWMAAVDRNAKLLLACSMDIPGFPGNAVFYSCPARKGPFFTMEVMTPTKEYTSGVSEKLSFDVAVYDGLQFANLVRPDYALYVSLKKDDKDIAANIYAASVSNKKITLKAGLTSKEKSALSNSFEIGGGIPGKAKYYKIKIPSLVLSKGNYNFFIEEADKTRVPVHTLSWQN